MKGEKGIGGAVSATDGLSEELTEEAFSKYLAGCCWGVGRWGLSLSDLSGTCSKWPLQVHVLVTLVSDVCRFEPGRQTPRPYSNNCNHSPRFAFEWRLLRGILRIIAYDIKLCDLNVNTRNFTCETHAAQSCVAPATPSGEARSEHDSETLLLSPV